MIYLAVGCRNTWIWGLLKMDTQNVSLSYQLFPVTHCRGHPPVHFTHSFPAHCTLCVFFIGCFLFRSVVTVLFTIHQVRTQSRTVCASCATVPKRGHYFSFSMFCSWGSFTWSLLLCINQRRLSARAQSIFHVPFFTPQFCIEMCCVKTLHFCSAAPCTVGYCTTACQNVLQCVDFNEVSLWHFNKVI